MNFVRSLPVLLTLCIAALPALAAEAVVHLSPEQRRALAVVSQPLHAFAAANQRRLPAQVLVPPTRMEVVSAPLAGTITLLKVSYGDTVKAGQPLLRLQGGQVLETQRDHAVLQSRAHLADEALKRDEALFADGIIPASRLSATRAGAREAQALLAERRQALALAGAAVPAADGRLSGVAELRAPFAGVVIEAPAQPGVRTEAGMPLVKLGRLDPLWLEIQASPAQAAGLAAGDTVRVPGCTRTARLTQIAPQLTPGSQAVLLRAELSKAEGCVKPFQHIEVEVQAARRDSGSFAVPITALAHHRGETWVFVETPGGFQPLAVTLLDESEQSARIRGAGLAADTRIAVKGVAAIKAAWMGLGGEAK